MTYGINFTFWHFTVEVVQVAGIEPTGLSHYVPNVARYQVTVYTCMIRSFLLYNYYVEELSHTMTEILLLSINKKGSISGALSFYYNQPENQRRMLDVTVVVTCPTLVLIFPAGQLSLLPLSNARR